MGLDINAIIQNHLSGSVAVEESTDVVAESTEVVEESTEVVVEESTSKGIDFSAAAASLVKDRSVEESTVSSDTNTSSYLTEGELSRIRGAIIASAVASNVKL